MSPQLRSACMNRTLYNAFKADVFALGASLLHLATLASPESLLMTERLDEAVGREVGKLTCSALLQTLLRKMLAADEKNRPNMQEICCLLSSSSPIEAPPLSRSASAKHVPIDTEQRDLLAQVTATHIAFFRCGTSTWEPAIRLRTQIQADQYSSWLILENGRLFCSGGECQSGGLQGRQEAYLLRRNGIVDSLPLMLCARYRHGAIEFHSSIFLFGGRKSYTDSSGYCNCQFSSRCDVT